MGSNNNIGDIGNGKSGGTNTAADDGSLIMQKLREIGIPPRPDIVERIIAGMRVSHPDFSQLSSLINADVGLAASLIRTVNSPYYGFGKRVRSVQDALMVIGLNAAIRTVTALALKMVFPSNPALERYWDGSSRIARLSGWLAQRDRRISVPPDEAYTYGLFRDCGIPVLLIPFPDYQAVLKKANDEPEAIFTEVEDAMFPTNHVKVGTEMAVTWLLPEEMCLAIEHHHDPRAFGDEAPAFVPANAQKFIALAHLAEHLVQHHTGQSYTREWLKFRDACLRLLALTEADLDVLRTESKEVIAAET
jgi:HD-like signal output (HDOD) protein